jgi:hypothetical protein
VLDKYDARTVQWALTLTGAATFVVYSLYTLDGQTRLFFGTPYLPLTIPFTALGILRFLFLVARSPMAESPTEEMLRDVPFMANLAVWGTAIVVIVSWLTSGEAFEGGGSALALWARNTCGWRLAAGSARARSHGESCGSGSLLQPQSFAAWSGAFRSFWRTERRRPRAAQVTSAAFDSAAARYDDCVRQHASGS